MQLNQPSPAPAPGGSGPDLPSWAQIFGTVFAVLAAMVAAATLSGAVAAILTAVATAFACTALHLATNRRPWTLPKQGQLAGALFCALVFAGIALAVAVTGNDDGAADPAASGPETTETTTDTTTETTTDTTLGAPSTPPATDTEAPAADVVIKKAAYAMVPSSSPLTNDRDKVDLDTGCPGWGPTSIPVGRSRCGERADLILESGYLHAPDEKPMLALLDAGQRATFATCRDALTEDTATSGVIPRSELRAGAQLCVLTDKDHVAAVQVVRRGGGVVIDFEVWE